MKRDRGGRRRRVRVPDDNRQVRLTNVRSVVFSVILGLAAQVFFMPETSAQTPPPPEEVEAAATLAPSLPATEVGRDSLMLEIRHYTQMIKGLRDSLTSDGMGGFQLPPERRESLQKNISEISRVIEQIGGELSELEFEIKENRISLVNEAGEGIVFNLPENLNADFSEGLKTLTKVILEDLPDSIEFDHDNKLNWRSFLPKKPAPRRTIVHGNLVRLRDDLQIDRSEDVRGNVVVAFGDVEISGRVEGNVINLFGNVLLDETAEITGKVVVAGGHLEQDPAAEVGEVVPIDLFGGGGDWDLSYLLDRGLLSFLVFQGGFLFMVLMAVIAVVATPIDRFNAIVGALRAAPGPIFGMGLLTALFGHVMAAVLVVVLVLTVIGLPVALLLGLALLVVMVVAVTTCAVAVGEWVCNALGGFCRAPWIVVVVGLAVLHLASFLGALLNLVGAPAPLATVFLVIGAAVKIGAYILGLGALVLTRLGARPAAS